MNYSSCVRYVQSGYLTNVVSEKWIYVGALSEISKIFRNWVSSMIPEDKKAFPV